MAVRVRVPLAAQSFKNLSYMKKNLILFLSAASVLALSSCSSKLGELSADNFKVTPNPLESKGGQVAVTINGTFPEKYLKKKLIGCERNLTRNAWQRLERRGPLKL